MLFHFLTSVFFLAALLLMCVEDMACLKYTALFVVQVGRNLSNVVDFDFGQQDYKI